MPGNRDPKWNIEDLTNAQIWDAIRYLEPGDPMCRHQNEAAALAISISLFILLLGAVALVWLYR
jgi:hypothetical protein